MRLNEIESTGRTVYVCDTFIQAFNKFSANLLPTLNKKLIWFVGVQESGNDLAGEEAFSGGVLKGFWRWIIGTSGGEILFYTKGFKDVKLLMAGPHKLYMAGASDSGLKNKLDKALTEEFVEFRSSQFAEKALTLTQEQRDSIESAIWHLIAEKAFIILKSAIANNDWRPFFEWAVVVPENINPTEYNQAVFAAFGGADALKNDIITAAVNTYGPDVKKHITN